MGIATTIPTSLNFPNRGVLERDDFVLAQETAQDLLAGAYTAALNQYATELNDTEADINLKWEQVKSQAVTGSYSQAYIDATFTPKVLNTQTDKATPVDADLFPLSDSASSFGLKKLSWANIKATLISSFGALINGLTAKTTPVDADMIIIADSAATNASKKLSWANIKATLKTYFDNLYSKLTPIIATGTATFTATTNNINLTGIGIGVEIGDVIQISGANDAKNNSEFTIEVITDANNIIVNQAHANKNTSKNVANRSGDTGVTVKLLAKWYNAPIGLGQGWVDVTSSRAADTNYSNNTKRNIQISVALFSSSLSTRPQFLIDGYGVFLGTYFSSTAVAQGIDFQVISGSTYQSYLMTIERWSELR